MGDVAYLNVKTNYRDVEQAERALDKFDNSARRAGRGAKQAATDMKATQTAAMGLSNAAVFARGAIGAMISVQAVLGIVRVADNMNLLQARVKDSVGATENFKQAFTDLGKISQTTGVELKTTVDIFQRLSFVRTELGATIDQMLSFTGTVEKLGVISGAGTASLNAGLMQLGQALGAGTVRAEEFNSLMENIPAVAVAISSELGVTTAQLKNLVIEGKVLSEDVFAAILRQTEEVSARFAAMPQTVGMAGAAFSQTFGMIIADVNSATGGTNALAMAIGGLATAAKVVYDAFMTISTGIAGTIAEMVNEVIRGINTVIDVANQGLAKLNLSPLEKLQGGMTYEAGETLGQVFDENTARRKRLDIYQDDPTKQQTIYEQQNAAMKKAGQKAEREAAQAKYDELLKGLGKGTKKDGLSEAQKAANKELDDAKSIYADVQTPAEKYATTVEKLNVYLNSGLISQTTFNRAIGKAKDELDKTDDAMQTMIASAKQFGQSMSDGFYDAITGARSFKSVLADLLNQLGKSLFNQGIGGAISGIGQSIFGSILGGASKSGGSWLSGLFGGGGGIATSAVGKSSIIGSSLKGLGTGIKFFADGGVVDRPTSFNMRGGSTGVMGEAGSEAIMPLRRGANGQLGVQVQGGQGGGNTITFAPQINASGADVAAVKRLESVISEMQRGFKRAVEDVAANKYARDPRFLRG
jgi:tape measure domain-containing protein